LWFLYSDLLEIKTVKNGKNISEKNDFKTCSENTSHCGEWCSKVSVMKQNYIVYDCLEFSGYLIRSLTH